MKPVITFNFDVEYAGQATELNNRIPYGYINKKVCGCGLSSLAIENNRPTIIAVPNQELTSNKASQYPNDRFNGTVFAVKAGVSQDDIYEYYAEAKTPKIMVTYDSLWKVEGLLATNKFDLVIDESEQLLKFQRMKLSDKEDLKEVDVLTKLFQIAYQYRDKVSFISATPVPLEYMPDWVAELDQVEMNWSNTNKAKPYLMERTYPFKALREEIIKPLQKDGKIKLNDIEITKVIVFINSVSNIVKIAKECELDPSEVALILGDNLSNDVKIKGYNRLQNPKKLPKYTFVTSVGFQGIDLYDKDAFSIVVSNTSQQFTMIDMLTDMKQAISRQRMKDNVNYGKYGFIYNQSLFDKSEIDLIKEMNKVEISIIQAMNLHRMAKDSGNMEGFELLAKDSKDFKIYTIYNAEQDVYELNRMAFNADRYMILELKRQFTKGFDIRGSFAEGQTVECKVEMAKEVGYADLVNYFKKMQDLSLDEEEMDWAEYSTRTEWIDVIEKCHKLYGKVWSNITVAKEMLANYNSEYNQIGVKIGAAFSTGKRYSRAEVKERLNKLYAKHNIKRKAKHTDLDEYFETKNVSSTGGERFVEVIRRK